MANIRVRFAPSPTGMLHIGAARTALFNWLYARKHGGVFIVRIEDTDKARSTPAFEEALLDVLHRLGVTWDEGPDIGGPYGPYRQSERLNVYVVAVKKLLASGHAYPCFCSTEELEAERTADRAARRPPRYNGKCATLSANERAAKEAEGVKPSLRLRVGGDDVTFVDGVRGAVRFNVRDFGDFIIVRSGGAPSFYLASAVDDVEMEITDVIRGEDHLSNTANQILIMRALGATPPRYAHLPIITGKDGRKLSKRAGAANVGNLLDAGYLPEAVTTAMAMLGWPGPSGDEVEPLPSLAEKFELADVSHTPSRFDVARLDHINTNALRALPAGELMETLRLSLKAAHLSFDDFNEDKRAMIAQAAHDALGTPVDVVAQLMQFDHKLEPDADAKKIMAGDDFTPVIEALRGALSEAPSTAGWHEAVIESVSLRTGRKGKKLYQPIRAAITGRVSGPKLKDLFSILGPQGIANRLDNA